MATIQAPSRAPIRKVRVAAVVGLVVTLAGAITDASTHVRLPAWLTAAAGVVATVGAAYLTASGADELPVQPVGVRHDGLVHGPGPDWQGE